MNEVKNKATFRSSIGGFNKADVVDYIAEENKKFVQEKSDLEQKLKAANDKIAELTQKLEAAESTNFILNAAKDEAASKYSETSEEASKRIEEAEKALEDMTAKYNEALKNAEDALESEKEAVAQRDEAVENIRTTIEESTRLRALVDGCTEQIEKYTDRIAELEASLASIKSGADEAGAGAGQYAAENEFLKKKYTELAQKFTETADYVTSLENKVAALSTELEKAQAKAETVGDVYTRKATSDVSDVSERAIDTIIAINHDVKGYMDDCVGEFDSYSRDINDSITKLLDDISERCRQLDEKIKVHRENVNKNIDRRFNDYQN